MTARELLLGSSFHLASDEGAAGGLALAVWGRFAAGGFAADVDEVKMDGDVTTGLFGVDAEGDRWLTGVALGERVSLWGLASYGWGELTLTEESEAATNRYTTDVDMTMGALGLRGTLLVASETNGFELVLKSDAFWMRMTSDKVEGMEGAEADASRLRLILDASRSFEMGEGGTLTPSLEIGVRHDGGDAETGNGLEGGAGIRYAGAGVTIEGAVSRSPSLPPGARRRAGPSGCGRCATCGGSRPTTASRRGAVSMRSSATGWAPSAGPAS